MKPLTNLMKPSGPISGRTALISRKPCGCVVGFALDTTSEKRDEAEAEGCSVDELPWQEADAMWVASKPFCHHGSLLHQLAAKVKGLEAIIARSLKLVEHALLEGIENSCGLDTPTQRILGTCVDVEHTLVGPNLIIATTQEQFDSFKDELLEAEVEIRLAKPRSATTL